MKHPSIHPFSWQRLLNKPSVEEHHSQGEGCQQERETSEVGVHNKQEKTMKNSLSDQVGKERKGGEGVPRRRMRMNSQGVTLLICFSNSVHIAEVQQGSRERRNSVSGYQNLISVFYYYMAHI